MLSSITDTHMKNHKHNHHFTYGKEHRWIFCQLKEVYLFPKVVSAHGHIHPDMSRKEKKDTMDCFRIILSKYGVYLKKGLKN